MPHLDPLESVAASELVSASLLASLVRTLIERNVLSPEAARDIYENALLLIEMQQGGDPAVQKIYQAARELIEAHLR